MWDFSTKLRDALQSIEYWRDSQRQIITLHKVETKLKSSCAGYGDTFLKPNKTNTHQIVQFIKPIENISRQRSNPENVRKQPKFPVGLKSLLKNVGHWWCRVHIVLLHWFLAQKAYCNFTWIYYSCFYYALPISVTFWLTNDLLENWMNWPLPIRMLIMRWWTCWCWSEIEIKVALAVKATKSFQTLSKGWTACKSYQSCLQLVLALKAHENFSKLLTSCKSYQSRQLVTAVNAVHSLQQLSKLSTASNSCQSCQKHGIAVKAVHNL